MSAEDPAAVPSRCPPPLDLVDVPAVLLLVGSGLFLFCSALDSYGLWEPWEPKDAQTVREMIERDDLMTPFYGGERRWAKPILIYWAILVPAEIFGVSELSARLPSALSALAAAMFVWAMLRRLRGRFTAFMGAGILMTMPQYLYMARQAMPDMLLVCCLTLAMTSLACGRFAPEHRRRHFWMFYGALGFAVLAKGPVAVVLLGGALGLFWLIDVDLGAFRPGRGAWAAVRKHLSDYHFGSGAVIFLAVASPWYLMMIASHGWDFVDSFFLGENVKRFSTAVRSHEGSIRHYFSPIFHGMYPWVGLLLAYPILGGRDPRSEESRQRWFHLCWALAVFLVFTAAGTKIDHYILPIAPALAILVALFWEDATGAEPIWVRLALVCGLLVMGITTMDLLREEHRKVFDVFIKARELNDPVVRPALLILLCGWGLVTLAALIRPGSRVVAVVALAIAFAHGVTMCHHVLPRHTDQRSIKPYVELYESTRSPDAALGVYGPISGGVIFYAGQHGFRPLRTKDLAPFVAEFPRAFILSRKEATETLQQLLTQRSGNPWWIVTTSHPNLDIISNDPRAFSYLVARRLDEFGRHLSAGDSSLSAVTTNLAQAELTQAAVDCAALAAHLGQSGLPLDEVTRVEQILDAAYDKDPPALDGIMRAFRRYLPGR